MPHREIPVQVTAWVDEGVAELVTALNAWPGILTLDSCQEDPAGRARVTFCTHDNAAIRVAMDHLARIIAGQNWQAAVSLSLWAGCDGDTLAADLACPPGLVPSLAGKLRSNADRMSGFSRGTAGTEPRNWTACRYRPEPLPSCGDTQRSGHGG